MPRPLHGDQALALGELELGRLVGDDCRVGDVGDGAALDLDCRFLLLWSLLLALGLVATGCRFAVSSVEVGSLLLQDASNLPSNSIMTEDRKAVRID